MQATSLPKPQIASQQSSVIYSILDSVKQISTILKHSPVVQLETQNKFGDQQLHQDVHSDQVVEQHLRKNPQINAFASQQRPQFNQITREQTQKPSHQYIVTYDPLDGSSIIDTNFTVGSIFSIWSFDQNKLIGTPLNKQVNALLALYGPRTTVIFYNRSQNKVQQLTLIQDEWFLSHEHLVIKPKTKMFSPGNLRAVKDNQEYAKVVQSWIDKEYTLRYTGGLVPDVVQIFVKGHGVFANIDSPKHKAKLRVLYEAAAVGFLIQKAEGATLTKGQISLMDYANKGFDDRISFVAGSKDEILELKSLF